MIILYQTVPLPLSLSFLEASWILSHSANPSHSCCLAPWDKPWRRTKPRLLRAAQKSSYRPGGRMEPV